MPKIETYTATIKIIFDVYERENPRAIAEHMADYYNCMRGANLYTCGTIEKLFKKPNERKIRKNN